VSVVGSPEWTQQQLAASAGWYEHERVKFEAWQSANSLQMAQLSGTVLSAMWEAWLARAELQSMPPVRFRTQFDNRPSSSPGE
jgi:hypothetical protein